MEASQVYQKKDHLLTKAEMKFYETLYFVVRGKYHINTMTRMVDLVDVNSSNNKAEFWKISQKHIDFTLCDQITMKPVLCIELDDTSHNRQDRIERDNFVNSLFKQINLPLLRIPTAYSYSAEKIGMEIEKYLDGNVKINVNIDTNDNIASNKKSNLIPIKYFILSKILIPISMLFLFGLFSMYSIKMISDLNKPKNSVIKKTKTYTTNKNNQISQKLINKPLSSIEIQKNETIKYEINIKSAKKTGPFKTIGKWRKEKYQDKSYVAILEYNDGPILIEQFDVGLLIERPLVQIAEGEAKVFTELERDFKYLIKQAPQQNLWVPSGHNELGQIRSIP